MKMFRSVGMAILAFVVLTFIVLAATPWLLAEPSEPNSACEEVAVAFLANEGFLLRCGEQRVLIDAFVTEPYSIYGAVPEGVWEQMVAGEGPFEQVQLALASHPHRDHFQPAAAAQFLAAHPETLFVSSPQVINVLREHLPPGSKIERQLQQVLPDPGAAEVVEHQGIQVEFLRLRHGGARWRDLHNLGHLIHLGGKTIVHVGDADTDPTIYAPYGLAARGLEIALIPAWFFSSPRGMAVIEEHLPGRHRIAAHISPQALAETRKQLGDQQPEIVVLSEALESRRY